MSPLSAKSQSPLPVFSTLKVLSVQNVNGCEVIIIIRKNIIIRKRSLTFGISVIFQICLYFVLQIMVGTAHV